MRGSRHLTGRRLFYVLSFAALGTLTVSAVSPHFSEFADSSGMVRTLNKQGAIDTSNPFFQSLGTNGRSCSTCHLASDGMGLSSAAVQAKFTATGGQDPLFADIDGANCPGAARDDAARHSLLTGHGLIRVALPMLDKADYMVQTVYDPYGCADYIDPDTNKRTLSEYRRPLPAANLRFLSTVMFDGRETVAPLTDPDTFNANLVTDLAHQAVDAALGHAQAATSPSNQQISSIVDFELGLFSAQASDTAAGRLHRKGATGGPKFLAGQQYYPGINDSLGGDIEGFTPSVFKLFDAWSDLNQSNEKADARRQIAAGEQLFNSFPITIKNVTGLNDVLNVKEFPGTCTVCHDTPNVGNHSLPFPLDLGVSHSSTYEDDPAIRAALTKLQVPDLPIFKVTCTATTPSRVVYTSDLGKALVSGHCADLIQVKGPILRGLAARAPYFHNGSAATLRDVIEFYNERFEIGFTEEQKQQLEAFLKAL
jgi:cytochrome c peroxidase